MNEEHNISSEFFERQQLPDMYEYSDFTALSEEGFAVVYKVRRFGRWYILKTLGEEFRGREPYESLLRKDFEIGIALSHANVVRYLDFVYLPAYGNAISMEYVEGQGMDAFISSEPSLQLKMQVFNRVLDGVEYLHAHQIVHRDLKPENIIVGGNGDSVKIIDLGLADKADYAILKEPAGTRGYAAPEIAQGGEHAEASADIFSLGKVLADMQMPARFDGVIAKCTRESKGERYQSIKELREAFNRKRRSKIPVLLGIACIAAVIGAITLALNDEHGQTAKVNPVSTAAVRDEAAAEKETPATTTPISQATAEADGAALPDIDAEKREPGDISLSKEEIDSIRHFNKLATQGYKGIEKIFDKYRGNGKTDTITTDQLYSLKIKCSKEMDALMMDIFKTDELEGVGNIDLFQRLYNYGLKALDKLAETYYVRKLTDKELRNKKRRTIARLHKADSVRNAARSQGKAAAPVEKRNK